MFKIGAKLPLYAFKRVNKFKTEMGVHGHEVREPEPPVAFLDSLVLGEVNFVKQMIKCRLNVEFMLCVLDSVCLPVTEDKLVYNFTVVGGPRTERTISL